MTASNQNRTSFTGISDPRADALFASVLPRLAKAVSDVIARGGVFGHVLTVCVGGGYARGEGGARDGRLCNDVDLYTVVDEATTAAEMRAIHGGLEALAGPFSDELGAEVEFCPPKKPSRIRHDRRRLMIQELLRGNLLLWGRDFSGYAPEFAASELPPGEAARLLMNRGMGLLLAREKTLPDGSVAEADRAFVTRNVNKAVLGAGDATLISRGTYDWSIRERTARFGRAEYAAAMQEKFAPGSGTVTWQKALRLWQAALLELNRDHAACLSRRSLWEAARWIRRRRTVGPMATFGMDCTVRVLARIAEALRAPGPAVPQDLLRDWQTFN